MNITVKVEVKRQTRNKTNKEKIQISKEGKKEAEVSSVRAMKKKKKKKGYVWEIRRKVYNDKSTKIKKIAN